tara:strand:+ start:147 stop:548 length:402 start_codon:yes stop_codon:yes gene_type:complete
MDQIESLAANPGESELTTGQIQALVDVLCLVIFADNRCSALEAAEFNGALLNSENLSRYTQVIRGQLNVASGPARHADEVKRHALASKAAQTLNGSGLKTSVYELASSLMVSPFNAGRQNPAILKTVRDAFEI